MNISPESHGIPSERLEELLRRLDSERVSMHSLLVARGDDIVLNAYWAPFTEDTLHRMNSVTKSYVSLAIGCLIDEGRVSLDDKVIKFFPEACEYAVNDKQAELTVRELLTMRTGYRPEGNGHWVRDKKYQRIKDFFERVPLAESSADFYYDSTGSYVLGAIVEKLTGGSFLNYLKDKFLRKIGFSESSDCIMGAEGYSWSDSGLLCTTEDLYKTLRFIAKRGVTDGVGYLSEDYLSDAVADHVSTAEHKKYCDYGYGYQIWRARDGGFMFVGMYCQFAMYLPSKDLYVSCTADNRLVEPVRRLIFETFYDIADSMCDSPLAENPEALDSLNTYVGNLALASLPEATLTDEIAAVLGRDYRLSENPMGIERIRVTREGERIRLSYTNAQGDKEIAAGIGYNEFSEFPEDGYPDMVIGQCGAYRYPIAASATVEGESLKILIQFIGKHLAALTVTITPQSGALNIRMDRTTECFLHTYKGEAQGTAI